MNAADAPEGPGWWQASDRRWYPPEQHPNYAPPPPPPPSTPPAQAGGFDQSGKPQEPPTPSGPAGFTYAPAGAYPGYRPPGTNELAVTLLILGIMPVVPLVGSVLAIVFGNKAKKQIDESGGLQTGRGMAAAGTILGWIGAVVYAFFGILVVLALLPGSSSVTCFSAGVPGSTPTSIVPCGPGGGTLPP